MRVDSSDYQQMVDLFARILTNGCNLLFKRGLDGGYQEIQSEIPGIKGKIDFKSSLNKNLFRSGKAICGFDEYQCNIVQNQIIKGTLKRFLRVSKLDPKLKWEVWKCFWKLNMVEDVDIGSSDFNRVTIHRNNAFYDFLLKICKLVLENTVLDQRTGKYHLKDFTGNEREMGGLFEVFVRNFYKKHQGEFHVKREDIKWDATPMTLGSDRFLPKMQTDVTLESPDRKIIIETKFYQDALRSRYDTEKFISSNLYQLYSYLRNIESSQSHPINSRCEGILLYPVVNDAIDESYIMGDHVLRVRTVDLGKEWNTIEEELMSIINPC